MAAPAATWLDQCRQSTLKELRLDLSDANVAPGNIIHVGAGVVSTASCSLRLTGQANITQKVVLDASLETTALNWKLSRNSLSVWEETGGGRWFNLYFDLIEQVHLKFPKAGRVELFHSTPSVEFFMEFPTQPNAAVVPTVGIWQTQHTVLVAGSADV